MASLKFILAAMLIAIFFLGMLHINKQKYSLLQDFQYYFYIIYVDLLYCEIPIKCRCEQQTILPRNVQKLS